MKMPKSLFRKGLVIGVICLLLLLAPVITAFSIQDRNNEELVKSESDALPDLVIQDVKHKEGADGWHGCFEIYVKNNGDGTVQGGYRKHGVRVFGQRILLPISYFTFRDVRNFDNKNPQMPGGVDIFRTEDFGHGGFETYYRVAFWINDGRYIEESNYLNNGVWAEYRTYFKDVEQFVGFDRISDFYPWITAGSSPWWYPGGIIEDNHFSQTTTQQTTQQTTRQQTSTIQQTQTVQQTIIGNFLNRLVRR